jgi:polyhydroxybutyrate depolymerase
VILGWLLAACILGAADEAAGPYPKGLSEATITMDGVERRYLVHVPTDLSGPPRALVLVLHGGGGEGLGVAEIGRHPLSVFREVADRELFIAVYPAGLIGRDGNPSWNDCRSDNRAGSTADDVAFLAALINKVRNQYFLPRSRVFMTGGSNGGQMTLAFAAQRPDLVAGIATSSANLPRNPAPGRCTTGAGEAVPALMSHGTADPAMPYLGGCVANLGGACNRGVVISAEDTAARWREQNGLARVEPEKSTVDLDSRDPGPADRFFYPGPAPFEWWQLDGAGHSVPSVRVRVPPSAASGRQNNDVEFAEIAWAFFWALLPPK